ncbi:MAG TPA: hydroxymethylbilane synthase, partial [Acidimicrobiales bacterium]|nr:hydroxymethylbilane synthase [Acidimicrobiales bacterium]
MTEPAVVRLATRGSPLALWQARRVAFLLEASGVATSLVTVETEGDRRTGVALHAIGGQGVFVKEVQAAVLRGEADAAVHSAKDLPAAAELQAPGLTLAAFPERADPRDLLVGATLDTLGSGSRVATGSARRRVQLANLRPDLLFSDLRGNLATRLSVGVDGTGDVAAVVVAVAGVERLEWTAPAGLETEVLDPMVMLPQVGQGALAVECREDDSAIRSALAVIDDPSIRRVVTAERSYLAELGGSCTLPVGAYGTLADDDRGDRRDTGEGGDGEDDRAMTLSGMMASEDGRMVLRHTASGDDPEKLGRA